MKSVILSERLAYFCVILCEIDEITGIGRGVGLLIEIKSLCNQVENFIRVTMGPKYPKNAFKVAVSLTTKVS